MTPLHLLDTNAFSDIMADHPKMKAKLATRSGQVLTSAIVRGEICYGLERLPLGKRRTDLETKATVVFASLSIEPVTEAVADIYGSIRRTMELKGWSLDDNDLWIAATALSLGAVLITRDSVFGQVPGLQVEDWTQ